MIYTTVLRRDLEAIVDHAEKQDPDVFMLVEPVFATLPTLHPPCPYSPNLRSVFVRK